MPAEMFDEVAVDAPVKDVDLNVLQVCEIQLRGTSMPGTAMGWCRPSNLGHAHS
jgi:hypothetical protein